MKKKRSKKVDIKKKINDKKKVVRRKKKVKPKKLIGMEIEQVYALINATQIKRIEQEIIIEEISSSMLENILNDCKITFTKSIKPDGFHYIIKPPPEVNIPDESFIFQDELPDELKEDGYCF